MHTPAKQAWFVQSVAPSQAPLALHVCTPLPEHLFLPEAHTPVHAPETHVWVPQSWAPPHCPCAPHDCTPLPAHRVDPGVQTPCPPPSSPPSMASAIVASVAASLSASLAPMVASTPPSDDASLPATAASEGELTVLLPLQAATSAPASNHAEASRNT